MLYCKSADSFLYDTTFTESYFQADYYFNLGFLDIGKFILHYVLLPHINHVIKSFIRGWNSRPLRSERTWTPE